MRLIEKIIHPSGPTHSATVIFFHGSGEISNKKTFMSAHMNNITKSHR
jgi:predicted esterase